MRYFDALRESDEFAEWLYKNALLYGVVVCNGDTMIAAMENDSLFEAFLWDREFVGA